MVEAKASYRTAADGLQQAKAYAEMLGLHFAYATNGPEIVEFDYFTGLEKPRGDYPKPDELWKRYCQGRDLPSPEVANQLVTPFHHSAGKSERYYQQIAVNRVVEAVLSGRPRLLVTMATGTGKTLVAFQICWKLWNSRWNRTGEHRRPRILYLADRNILIDQPKDGIFAPFGDARCKIESGEVVKSREMYFAIYQALAEDERREGLFRDYPPDFFDLVIVDECHRGSARDDSSWRGILEPCRFRFRHSLSNGTLCRSSSVATRNSKPYKPFRRRRQPRSTRCCPRSWIAPFEGSYNPRAFARCDQLPCGPGRNARGQGTES